MDAVRVLTEHGADINTPDNYGYTPLTGAIMRNKTDVVTYLVSIGADITRAMARATPPAEVLEVLELFCQRCHVQCSPEIYPLFALVQLMSSTSAAVNSHGDDSHDAKVVFEAAIACELRQHVASTTIAVSYTHLTLPTICSV